MKRMFFSLLFVCWLLLFAVYGLMAQEDGNIEKKSSLNSIKLKLTFRTDLQVVAIHSSRCLKDKNTQDSFYMANIMVDVANHKVGKVGAACESILTISYFDMRQGKKVTLIRQLPKMSPYPEEPWTIKRFVVVMVPVMVNIGTGITARIKPKRNTVSDPVPENNSLTVNKCTLMVY
jgi:hypothetical protein